MTSLQTLLEELASDGVTHRRLGDLASLGSARVAAGVLDPTTYVGVDNLLADFGGRRDAGYGVNSSGAVAFDVGDILIGNIRPYLKKVWLADRSGGASPDVLVVSIDRAHRDSLLPRFLYFALASERFIHYSMKHAKGAKMPRGSKVATLDYRVPVPPLEVQREIVRVLDHFTELEAKLEAELEARRLQYAHLRSRMLATVQAAKSATLGEVATIGTGSHDTKDAVPNGKYVFYARGRETLALDSFDFDEVAIITAGDGAGVGKVFHFASGKYALHQRAYRIVPGSEIHPRYLYHYLVADFERYLEQISVRGSVNSLRKPMFMNFPISLPSMDEQTRIVEVLDKFDALVNDLSIGLPAELAARRKQYEYYRDKLLTFEEAPA